MRYLLVGNGAASDVELKAKHADAVIQINDCRHAARIPTGKTSYVVICNTGEWVTPKVMMQLQDKKALLANISLLLARNPVFYRLKGALVGLSSRWRKQDFKVQPIASPWPIITYPFVLSVALEWKLLRLGMSPGLQPSTGLLAYWWLRHSMNEADSVELTGFSFEGWERHPWALEKAPVQPVYYPGYRDDPSYEKRPPGLRGSASGGDG